MEGEAPPLPILDMYCCSNPWRCRDLCNASGSNALPSRHRPRHIDLHRQQSSVQLTLQIFWTTHVPTGKWVLRAFPTMQPQPQTGPAHHPNDFPPTPNLSPPVVAQRASIPLVRSCLNRGASNGELILTLRVQLAAAHPPGT
eukprot:353182-Chlamydomonas_euryale.AAC.50